MSEPSTLLLGLAVLGGLIGLAGFVWMRLSGADLAMARRLAGARGLAVADVLDLAASPPRAVRVAGRIRCADPLIGPDDEAMVAYHRDVAVRMPDGRWQTIERIREHRSFELWDHAGSLRLDPAEAAEPLITMPAIWEGDPAELEGPHAAAVERLTRDEGAPLAARAVTRVIPVTDPLLVLAQVRMEGGSPSLAPPRGGYLISALDLSSAMRLLGGSRRRQLTTAIGMVAGGALLGVVGLVGALLARLAGA